jgi:hypothetical protein
MDRFLRILAAAIATAVPLAQLDRQFLLHGYVTRAGFLLELVILLPLAALMFVTACKLFRVKEIYVAGQLFWNPLQHYMRLLNDRIRS